MTTRAVAHNHDTLVSENDRRRYGRRAQLLAGASVTYNVIEAIIAVTAGVLAGSVALIGFGLDSVVEVSSGLIILWQFRHPLPESRERTALRLMAFSFFGLAAYVTFESVRSIITGHQPDSSPVGITSRRPHWSSCPSCPGRSAAPDAPSVQMRSSPTPPKRCYARTCP